MPPGERTIRSRFGDGPGLRVSGHKTAAMFTRYDITGEDDKRDALMKTQEHRAARPTTTPTLITGTFGKPSE